MIGQSVPIMTAIDVVILLCLGTMTVYLRRNWALFGHPRQVRYVRMIVIGMFAIVPIYGYLGSAALLSGYYLFSVTLNVQKTFSELRSRAEGTL